jgi:hypothetical protein
MRGWQFLILAGLVCLPARTSTLQHLSLKDMALQSTDIVRGHVQRGKPAWHGSLLFTHYLVFVSDRWKGTGGPVVDLAVQGGVLDGLRQTWAGTPNLVDGREYVLFLWRSHSGLNLIIGLSQGLFAVDTHDEDAVQASTGDAMVDGAGAGVTATPVRMKLTEMRKYVERAIAEAR